MNIGEELVSAYLQYINNCRFVQTGVYLADIQGEIDVVGINIDKKIVYICEVAIHLETGLQYVSKNNRPNNVNKLIDKFTKDIEYANKFFQGYTKIIMLWCPIVKNQGKYAKYNQINDLNEIKESIKTKFNIDIEMIVNEKFLECIAELRNYALNETKNNTNPVIRFLQIEEKLKKHLQSINRSDVSVSYNAVGKKIRNNMHVEYNSLPKNQNDIVYLNNLIKSIGMATFVKYYELFVNENYSSGDIIQHMKQNENYTINSLRTKSSSGRRIFREGLEKDALIIISKSDNVDINTREKAKNILNNNK